MPRFPQQLLIFLKQLLILAPAVAAWCLASTLLSDIYSAWLAEEMNPWPVRSLFDTYREFFPYYWSFIALLLAFLLGLHLFFYRSSRLKPALAIFAWVVHAGTFLGLLFLTQAGVIAYLTTRADLVHDVFGSEENLVAITSTTQVSVVRLKSIPKSNPFEIRNYERGSSIPLSSEQVAELKIALLRKSIYGWRFAKGCAPEYAVSFVFAEAPERIELAICFRCLQFALFRNGTDVSEENDIATGRFLKIVQELYPDDPAIQELGKPRPRR